MPDDAKVTAHESETLLKLFVRCLAGSNENESATALNKLKELLAKKDLHPSELRMVEAKQADREAARTRAQIEGLRAEGSRWKAEKILAEAVAQQLKWRAEDEKKRHRAETSQRDKEHKKALSDHKTAMKAERAAKCMAESRAELHREALEHLVTRTKMAREQPLVDAAVEQWNRLERAVSGFARSARRQVISAVSGMQPKELARFAELRSPVPDEIVTAVESYVARFGRALPEEVKHHRKPKSAQHQAAAAVQREPVGILTGDEVQLLRACELEPDVLRARLHSAERQLTDRDREIMLVLRESYGVNEADMAVLLGLRAGRSSLAQIEKWMSRLSDFARLPVERIRQMLQSRQLPPQWGQWLNEAVAG